MGLAAISIVMLRPLKFFHKAEALYVELANLWVTEIVAQPASQPPKCAPKMQASCAFSRLANVIAFKI